MNPVNAKQKPIRILHLEDSSLDIDLFNIQLRSWNHPHSIKHVSTEKEFIATLEKTYVDIVVSDSNLPGFDTGKALALVREKYPTVPFIFFSGHLSPEIQKEALSHGASAFIDKNDPGRLISTIEQFCNGRHFPAPGHAVIVQCKGFRCLACRTEKGKWVDLLQRKDLPEVLSWYDP